MSLIRLRQFLHIKNQNLRITGVPSSTVHYSDNSKISDGGDKTKTADKNKKNTNDSAVDSDEKAKIAREITKRSKDRINALLGKMSFQASTKKEKKIETSKPRGYRALREAQKLDARELKPKNVVDAAKNVADEIGGDTDKTQAELLSKFNVKADGKGFMDNVISKMKAREDRQSRTKPFVGTFDKNTKARDKDFDYSLRKRQPLSVDNTRSQPSQKPHETQGEIVMKPVDLFNNAPLGIFTDEFKLLEKKFDSLRTWSKLEQHDVKLQLSQAPRNYFEKMAYWTEEGKIWKFPIDNEQGLDEEAKVLFTEHVFLEDYIEPWCPKKGSVRNFMELVCVGLSKNPYLTVQQKREHIEWYRDYFAAKKDILDRAIVEQKQKLSQIQIGSEEKPNAE